MMRAPRDAAVLIIGGGIIGCSIAYHLAAMGRRDIVVLEKSGITHGATWHAAGLVGQLRSSRDTTRMLQLSVALYDRLEAETGIGWHKTGSLRLASSPSRLAEIKRLSTMARSFGLDMAVISGKEARELFPPMSARGVKGAAFIPSDGYIDPSGAAQALAKGARAKGVVFIQGERAEKFIAQNRRISEVVTDKGRWRCETLVNAAGMWARDIGRQMGMRLPVCAIEHQYIVTDPIAGVHSKMPTLRDPDNLVYYKPDAGALVIGGYENNPAAFGADGIPAGFDRQLLPGNYDRFAPLAERATRRTPILAAAGVRRIVNGPIPYSADGEFVMGRAAEWENVFIAAGFLYGIAAGGGAGRMMAEWIAQDAPSLDLWPLDLRRFTFHHGSKFFLYRRAAEHYAHHYKFRAPDAACQSARGLRRSPLYYPLKARGARYFEKAGWERPGWFSPGGKDEAPPPYLRAAGFARIGAECRAARKHAVLIDQSSFAKIEIRGPDAPDCLERIAAARIKNRPIGAVVYTPLCNERGGIEADVTITRFCGDGFYIVTGAAFGAHNFAWIKSRLPAGGNFFVNDVTSAFAVLNLAGPRAREILAAAAEEDVSNEAFPFASCRNITLGAAPARAMRVGYTGELGFELHIPAEFACHVYEHLLAAGEREGIADAGYGALESLRLEKGYVYWSRDVSPLRTPFEAGLGRFVALDKDAPFIGKEALARQKAAGVENKLCLFAAQTDALLLGGEAILCGDKAVGYATSAGYGHCVKKNLAIGYLPRALWTRRNFQIEAYGERYPLRRLQTAAWDSRGVRLRA